MAETDLEGYHRMRQDNGCGRNWNESLGHNLLLPIEEIAEIEEQYGTGIFNLYPPENYRFLGYYRAGYGDVYLLPKDVFPPAEKATVATWKISGFHSEEKYLILMRESVVPETPPSPPPAPKNIYVVSTASPGILSRVTYFVCTFAELPALVVGICGEDTEIFSLEQLNVDGAKVVVR